MSEYSEIGRDDDDGKKSREEGIQAGSGHSNGSTQDCPFVGQSNAREHSKQNKLFACLPEPDEDPLLPLVVPLRLQDDQGSLNTTADPDTKTRPNCFPTPAAAPTDPQTP